jgi:hypothetical protein
MIMALPYLQVPIHRGGGGGGGNRNDMRDKNN